MVVVILKCQSEECGKENKLVKYWKGNDVPDHRILCHYCGKEIPIKASLVSSSL